MSVIHVGSQGSAAAVTAVLGHCWGHCTVLGTGESRACEGVPLDASFFRGNVDLASLPCIIGNVCRSPIA